MPGVDELSEREKEILRLVATGASNKEIAQQLHISSNTVKVHLRNIFAKIDVTSRTEAAMYAVNAGIVSGPISPREIESAETSETGPTQVETTSEQALPSAQPASKQLSWWGPAALILLVIGLIWLVTWNQRQSVQPETVTEITQTPPPAWRNLAPMPTARYSLAAAAYENQIFAIGGMTDNGTSDLVEMYDLADDAWQTKAPKPTGISEAEAALMGGKIFVPGGRLASGEPTDVLEIYDPRTDSWTQGSPLPAPRSAYALAVFEGQLYLICGWDGESYQDDLYRYNPFLDQWSELPAMPTARAYSGAAVTGGKIIVFGGYDGKRVLAVNEIFDPGLVVADGSPWKTGQPMPEGVYAMGAGGLADIAFILGGIADGERKFPALAYFHQSDEWREVEGLAGYQNAYFGSASLGADLFAIGGLADEQLLATNQAYQFIFTQSMPIIIR